MRYNNTKSSGERMQEKWELKHTNNLNQMLRIKNEIHVNKDDFGMLLIVKHQYHVADDIMFPDPACLAFFTSFEENHLSVLEKEQSACLVGVDIFEGLMQFFIYCKDANKTLHDCIAYLKSNPNFGVEFEIITDNSWQRYASLRA